MSESEIKYEYRSYTIEEISRLLEISDEREKVIILLLASTGIRVGAVHPLLFKDLKKWVIDENGDNSLCISYLPNKQYKDDIECCNNFLKNVSGKNQKNKQ